MRIIPVIDLLGGAVVRGIAGRRDTYRPIASQIAVDFRPATIAQVFAKDFGFETAYVADLDAILHGRPDVSAWQHIAAAGLRLWLDAGIGTSAAVADVLRLIDDAIEVRLVIGLESLESEAELIAIRECCGNQPPIFSLDMKAGKPLTRTAAWKDHSPLELAQVVIAAGYRDLIVLDLADVGTNAGTRTLDLCREIHALPGLPPNLIAGGGVRSIADLHSLAQAGAGAALVASALHDKRLSPSDVRDCTG